ncbi:hypothetical protein SAMN03159343_0351 [Klenkia marina]|uniref:Uncharacterized protein n=1 Tax=Klenkia marina TaxID=1960309 RepID=A0A1G4XC56_9ACTN|nr:hypothetical protein [Klenkia marina]SCX38248.1 hypothetical protein SAMN03159343_0351 [Klenkia marina]
MTTTVCDAVGSAGTLAATLSSATEGQPDLFLAAGWMSTAVTEALEAQLFRELAPLH